MKARNADSKGGTVSTTSMSWTAGDKPGFRTGRDRMTSWSLNYRDLMVVKGSTTLKRKFPIIPLSDGAQVK